MNKNKELEMRKLIIKSYHIDLVEFGSKLGINDRRLYITKDYFNNKLNNNEFIERINLNIIKPKEHKVFVNSIMDIIPISTKVLGKLGDGITHTLTGVYVMMTGADFEGNQMAEFGSSEGILENKLCLNMAGTPNNDDYIIHVDIIFKKGLMTSRKYPMEGHRLCDLFLQEIRNILKKMPSRECNEKYEYFDKIRYGKKRIAIVKQIAGQGAMYDNQLFSDEPSGFDGGRSIIDIGNVPILVSPNEYRDGALRSMV